METSAYVNYLANLWLSFIWFTLIVSFILAIFRGPLLSTWIFISSLQLIAHIPLLNVRLPANANIFLRNMLNFTRLNFAALESKLDDLEEDLQDSLMMGNQESFYSSHLYSHGYHFSLVRNSPMILLFLCAITFVWICATCSCCAKRGQTMQTRYSREVFISNFMARFLYMAFFELVLCALITISDRKSAGLALWSVSLLILLAAGTAILAIASKLCLNGPFVRGTYAQGSFLSSLFWGTRQLGEEHQEELDKVFWNEPTKGRSDSVTDAKGQTVQYSHSYGNSTTPFN